MTDHQSAMQRLRDSVEARKSTDPRIDAMVADVRQIRTETRGLSAICNFASGNARDAFAAVESISEKIMQLEQQSNEQRRVIEEQQATITGLLKRMDDSAKWAKGIDERVSRVTQ